MSYYSDRRILVTGGAGFLGSHLCECLISEGHEVICVDNCFTGPKQNIAHLLDHPKFQFIRHDITIPLCLEYAFGHWNDCPVYWTYPHRSFGETPLYHPRKNRAY